MIFINTNNKNKIFREYKANDATLYIHGYTNYSDESLLIKLKDNKVPKDLKGQFGIVFISPKHWIGIVDHLCTTQLFYSKDHISPSLKTVKDNTKFLHEDDLCKGQLAILREHTVGDVSPWKEIKRIDFQHYAINSVQHQYANILNNKSTDYDVEAAYDLYISKAKLIFEKETALLFSGGKDSAFIAMLLKEIDIEPRLIHITSKNINHSIDDRATNKYRNFGWSIEEHMIEYSGPTNELETELFSSNFWKDDTHPPKRQTVIDYKGVVTTGEVTIADTQRKTYCSYFANAYKEIQAIDVVNRYIIHKHFQSSKKLPFTVDPNALGALYHTEAYQYIMNYYLNIIKECDKPIVYSHFELFNLTAVAARIYAQSQDPGARWVNIFSDYDIYNMNANMTWRSRDDMINNIQKLPLYNVAKRFKAWTDVSWNMPMVGLGIPDSRKFYNV